MQTLNMFLKEKLSYFLLTTYQGFGASNFKSTDLLHNHRQWNREPF